MADRTAWPSSGACSTTCPDGLARDGVAFLEIGADQGEAIVALAAERLPGWTCPVATDLAGLPRVARSLRRPARHDGARHVARLREFPIRLIALDIDGTLIGDDLDIGPRTRAAIRAAMERDVAVSLVTGRMVSSAMRFARDLGLTGPVVGYQGGLIRAMPDADRAGSASCSCTRRCRPRSPATSSPGRATTGWIRTSTTSSGSSSARTTRTPTTTRRSWARGPSSCRTSLTAIEHPVTKVLAVGEPPMPDRDRARGRASTSPDGPT